MLFNSYTYLIFLPISFFLYWFVFKRLRIQNLFLLVISYIFYGWWDWRFLSLIAFSSLLDFLLGIRMSKLDSKNKRKPYLWISLAVNLGLLGILKYFNFFSKELHIFGNMLGWNFDQLTLDVILPVGISFYTFQTLSYSIDVYRGELKAEKNWINFFAYVSFFPQLVAGPIERASNLLPQFKKARIFDNQSASNGMKLILWGLFKKMVIADNCATYVNETFANYHNLGGLDLILGAVLFAFQIYGDFSGYSDIAIGSAKLFGFDLMTNFKTPYFSRNIAEFWRRWHISLSTWFKDYVYIPLGGSKVKLSRAILNVFIIFLISGFWHGANWTYIVWGGLNAAYFMPSFIIGTNRKSVNAESEYKWFPSLQVTLRIFYTFILTCIAWIFFRANTLNEALNYLINIFSNSFLNKEGLPNTTLILIAFLLLIDWFFMRHKNGLEKISSYPIVVRYLSYTIIIFLLLLFSPANSSDFIYFQF